jgi:hypothetical protein
MASSSTKIGISGVLLIVFITLKLTHLIDWNWWWVLSPIWIPLAFITVVALFLAIIKALA